MKKVLVPLCIFLVIGLGTVVFAISTAYNNVQYEKDALAHVMAVNNGGELTAEFNGQVVRVLGDNIGRIKWVVTISERTRLYTKPKYDANGIIRLHFSDGAEYIIAYDPSVYDGAFILYSYKGKSLYFSIKGYKTMEWASRAISPEGINNPNELIK